MAEILWRFADGDRPENCRFATTSEFIDLAEEVGGASLPWFWQRYLHTAELPRWRAVREPGRLVVEWDEPSFEMPLPVSIDGRREILAMPGGRGEMSFDPGSEVVVDPEREVLWESR